MSKYVNLIAIGDANSNKTDLLIRYTYSNKRKEYAIPKVFINNIQEIIVDRLPYKVHFMDSETDDDYKILRENKLKKADCVLMCYSISNRSTFENLKKWFIEVRGIVPEVPIILVGKLYVVYELTKAFSFKTVIFLLNLTFLQL